MISDKTFARPASAFFVAHALSGRTLFSGFSLEIDVTGWTVVASCGILALGTDLFVKDRAKRMTGPTVTLPFNAVETTWEGSGGERSFIGGMRYS